MQFTNTNFSIHQVEDQVAQVYEPDSVEITNPNKALKNEEITQEEFDFLTSNHYQYLIIGETEVFASRQGELWKELIS